MAGASQLQLRRGTTVQHGPFIGAPGEVTVDTDKKTVVVHDGSTAGGFPSATTSELTAGLATKVSIGAAAGGALAGTYPNPTLAAVIATGSTEPRFVSDRFADTVNVKDFGAVGDGVADDTAAIQAAIDAARPNSKPVYLPTGTYRVTASLNFTGANDQSPALKSAGWTMYGDGYQVTRITATLSQPYPVLDRTDSHRAILRDLQIQGQPEGSQICGVLDSESDLNMRTQNTLLYNVLLNGTFAQAAYINYGVDLSQIIDSQLRGPTGVIYTNDKDCLGAGIIASAYTTLVSGAGINVTENFINLSFIEGIGGDSGGFNAAVLNYESVAIHCDRSYFAQTNKCTTCFHVRNQNGNRARINYSHSCRHENQTGFTKAATISNASPAVVTCAAHGLENGWALTFSTTGSLPTGITAGTPYYVSNKSTDTFEIKDGSGNTINTSSAGSGTQSINSGIATRWMYVDGTFANSVIEGTVTGRTPNLDPLGTIFYLFDGDLANCYIRIRTNGTFGGSTEAQRGNFVTRPISATGTVQQCFCIDADTFPNSNNRMLCGGKNADLFGAGNFIHTVWNTNWLNAGDGNTLVTSDGVYELSTSRWNKVGKTNTIARGFAGMIKSDWDSVSTTGPAGSDETLLNLVLAGDVANAIDPERRATLRLSVSGVTAANANTKGIKVKFGPAGAETTLVLNDVTTAPNNADWLAEVEILRTNSSNGWRCHAKMFVGSALQKFELTSVSAYAIAPNIAQTATISNGSPAVITAASAHNLEDTMAVSFSTTGSLPTGLTAGTIYYVVNKTPTTFNVEATIGGGAINTSSAGSGTHTVTTEGNRLIVTGDAAANDISRRSYMFELY